MHKILLLLLLGIASLNAQELITEADTIWMREYGYVTDVNFSPDGTRLVVTEPGAYYVYDSFTGEEIFSVYLPGLNDFLYTKFIDNERLLTRKSNTSDGLPGSTYIHNIVTNKVTQFIDGENKVAYAGWYEVNQTKNLVYLQNGHTIEVWNYEEMRLIKRFFDNSTTKSFRLSNDATKLCVATNWTYTNQEGFKENRLSLDLYELDENGLLGEKQVLFENQKLDLNPHHKDFTFDETDTKILLPTQNKAMYYDLIENSLVDLEISDYFRGGLLIGSNYFYANNKAKLKSFNLISQETKLKSELLGGYSIVKSNLFLFGGGGAIYVFDKFDVLNSTSVNDNILLPLEINSNYIIAEPNYTLELYDINGLDHSNFINNNKINRSELPTGTYFLTIQKGDYNKVFKFMEVR